MTIITKLLSFASGSKKFYPAFFRNYSATIERQLEVPVFCDIHINIPYNVKVTPLNVHKYHNLDQLVIKVDEERDASLVHDVVGNQVKIFDSTDFDIDSDFKGYVSIKAPVKSNIYVHSRKDIQVGYFQGDKLHLKTHEGNIEVDKFQGSSVDLATTNGNIHLKDFVQASNVKAEIKENGSVTSGRIQGLDVRLKTKTGSISVESSYALESSFEAEKGTLELHNVHKSCRINLKDGHLYLTGFDGKLDATVEKGNAVVQLSRITNGSKIDVRNGGLKLKISDACQDYAQFRIESESCDVAESVKSLANVEGNRTILVPDVYEENTVDVKCVSGPVTVESASWQDVIKLRMKMKNK